MHELKVRHLSCAIVLLWACGDMDDDLVYVVPEIRSLPQPLIDNVGVQELSVMREYLDDQIDPSSIVHSIRHGNGDVFDCIEFERQRSIQKLGERGIDVDLTLIRPRRALRDSQQELFGEVPLGAPPVLADLSAGQESCASGTVAVRRIPLEELAEHGSLRNYLRKGPGPFPQLAGSPTADPHEYADANLFSTTQYGSAAVLNVWSPSVAESSGHFSLSQLWATRVNPNAPLQTVEAGWIARKNQASRLFIFFTSNDYQNFGVESCWNADCGFVQTASGTFLNNTWGTYSSSGGTQIEAEFVLMKDDFDGHWWFQYQGTWVGYWHRDLFDSSGIFNNARDLAFGGEISYPSSLAQHTHTDMGGDGTFGSNSSRYGHAAYHRNMRRIQMNFGTGSLEYQTAGATLDTPTRIECYDNFRQVYASPWNETIFHGGIGFHQSGPLSNHCTAPSP